MVTIPPHFSAARSNVRGERDIKQLGFGAYGLVHHVKKSDLSHVARKCFESGAEMRRERDMLLSLNHDNVIKILV